MPKSIFEQQVENLKKQGGIPSLGQVLTQPSSMPYPQNSPYGALDLQGILDSAANGWQDYSNYMGRTFPATRAGYASGGIPGGVGGFLNDFGQGYDMLAHATLGGIDNNIITPFWNALTGGSSDQAPAGPAPEPFKPPQDLQSVISAGASWGGTSPMSLGFSAPYQKFSTSGVPLPAAPQTDFSALAALRPQTPDQTTPQKEAGWQGLVQAGMGLNPMASPAETIFKLGLGALAGQGQAKAEARTAQNNLKKEQGQFDINLETNKLNQKQNDYQNQLNLVTAGIQKTRADNAAKATEAEQLKPQISSKAVIIPEHDQKTGQINYKVQTFGDTKASAKARRVIEGMDTNVNALYDSLIRQEGGVDLFKQISDQLPSSGVDLQAYGQNDKAAQEAQRAMVWNVIKNNSPQLAQKIYYDAIRAEVAKIKAKGTK